jgi:hypothetical protein
MRQVKPKKHALTVVTPFAFHLHPLALLAAEKTEFPFWAESMQKAQRKGQDGGAPRAHSNNRKLLIPYASNSYPSQCSLVDFLPCRYHLF